MTDYDRIQKNIQIVFNDTLDVLHKYKEEQSQEIGDNNILSVMLKDVSILNEFIHQNTSVDHELFLEMVDESLVNIFFKYSIIIVYMEYVENYYICGEIHRVLKVLKPDIAEQLVADNIKTIKEELMGIFGDLIK